MKTFLLFAATMVLSTTLWAQLELNYEIEFTHFQQDYIPLEEYTNLTEGLGAWDFYDLYDQFLILNNPVVMPGFEDRPLNFLHFDGFAGFELVYSNPGDPYELFLISAAIDDYAISPLADDNNTDQGHILFLETDEGFVFEFQNVGLEEEMYQGDGNLVSRVNFQVEYHYNDRCVQFNYGHSEIGAEYQAYIDEWGMLIGTSFGWYSWESIDGESDLLGLFGLVYGDPSNPSFETVLIDGESDYEDENPLLGIPAEGTVYRFCFDQTTSTEEIVELSTDLTLYPNPATDMVYFSLPEEDASRMGDLNVQVIDLSGNVVIESEFGPDLHGGLNVEMLPTGMYFVRLTGENLSQTVKMVKK